jgi:hypothetical protein
MIAETSPAEKEKIPMPLTRCDFLQTGLAASAGLVPLELARAADAPGKDVHQQLLDLAAQQQAERQKRFAAVTSKRELERLLPSLRKSFLDLLDGLPERKGAPPSGGNCRGRWNRYRLLRSAFPVSRSCS